MTRLITHLHHLQENKRDQDYPTSSSYFKQAFTPKTNWEDFHSVLSQGVSLLTQLLCWVDILQVIAINVDQNSLGGAVRQTRVQTGHCDPEKETLQSS